jgi:DNA polymerase/3'-5' exonuclease PolX
MSTTTPLLDLRDLKITPTATNEGIIACLETLIQGLTASKEKKPKDTMRLLSFTKAVKAIKAFDQTITSGEMAKTIPGIGKGIADRIDEFLQTGGLKEIKPDETTAIVTELCTVTGIGAVRAQKLIADYGVKNVPDLIQRYKTGEIEVKPNALTHHIAIGLDYYYDLMERFSFAEADSLVRLLKKIVPKDFQITICGSYRRELPTCGDLDVILSPAGPSAIGLPEVIEKLEGKGFLVGHLTQAGDTKYMGVCRLPGGKGRRIDIRYIDLKCLGAAQLYFTGSGEFNKRMRLVASQKGYTLNEYGLFLEKELLPCTTEEEIFDKLQITYLSPRDRSLK